MRKKVFLILGTFFILVVLYVASYLFARQEGKLVLKHEKYMAFVYYDNDACIKKDISMATVVGNSTQSNVGVVEFIFSPAIWLEVKCRNRNAFS